MNMPAAIFTITWGLIILLWTLFLTKGKLVSCFNLIDKRSLIEHEQTYQKLNQMLMVGEVSIHSHRFMSDELSHSLYIEYDGDKDEKINKRLHGDNINKLIDEGYAWSVTRGFIKE